MLLCTYVTPSLAQNALVWGTLVLKLTPLPCQNYIPIMCSYTVEPLRMKRTYHSLCKLKFLQPTIGPVRINPHHASTKTALFTCSTKSILLLVAKQRLSWYIYTVELCKVNMNTRLEQKVLHASTNQLPFSHQKLKHTGVCILCEWNCSKTHFLARK